MDTHSKAQRNSLDRRPFFGNDTMTIAAVSIVMTIVLGLAGSTTVFAQDKYSAQVPDGLAFSEFRGFENWATVAVSQAGDLIEVIVANSVMIDAYRAGAPNNGQAFPDGAKMAKIHWNAKQSTEAPDPTAVPGDLHDIDFMVRDSKRFTSTGNWGYAQFNYDSKSDKFTPFETGSGCGFSCHTIVKDKDYVFTAYGKR